MPYHFKAADLGKLYGHSFSVNDPSSGIHQFAVQPKNVFHARGGLEAIGVKVLHTTPESKQIHAFLKIFRLDIPDRRKRTHFLAHLGLAKQHWAFHGVPYGQFPGWEINGVRVVAHLTKFIGMEFGGPASDLSELKEKWGMFSIADRTSFASHLTSAIYALERIGIVHGDLAPNNIMIGPGPGGRLSCFPCDFDGFYHPKVPLLPRQFDNQDSRPLGTPGYQYPDLIRKIAADTNNSDTQLYVRSDRFALAALVCELMVWENDTYQQLGRGELVGEEVILKRTITSIPPTIRSRFPTGFDLLETALNARTIEDMPTPENWLNALGVKSVVPQIFLAPPKIICRRRNSFVSVSAHLNTQQAGDFSFAHSSLKNVAYSRESVTVADKAGERVRLTFMSELPALVRRAGRSEPIKGDARHAFEVYPDDTICISDWEISFTDSA